MQFKSIAFAVAALCAASAASAATVTINGAGASATRATLTNVIVESVCGAAASTTVYHNGSNVTRIVCPTTVFGGADTLDFSYDNTTGSYLGVGPVSGNGQLSARINVNSCTGNTTETIAGKTVTSRTGCANEGTLVRPGIGNADVEVEMFAGANIGALPAVVPSGIDQVNSQFGIIYGVVASEALYKALQADQGLTVGSLTDAATAPSLSRAQIASLATANGGPLNNDWTALFTTPPAAASNPVRFVRRVAGSGTQTSFNANFLNYLCSARGSLPATAADSSATYVVEEQGSTGTLLASVSSTSVFKVGIASRENNQTASTPATPNWGFVKIDGVYPSKANAQNGRYNWVAEQVLTLRTGFSAVEKTLYDRLVTLTASPTTINGFSAAAKDGTVALPFVADAGDPNYLTHRTRFRTFGNSCVVPIAAE
jgi:hypothetical protein